MARVKTHVHHFSAGEASDAGLARIDLELARLFAEVQENLFPHRIGKGQFRPGTKYLTTSLSGNRPRYLPFVREIDDVALLELTDSTLRVLVDDTVITRPSVTSSVTNGDFGASGSWTLTASDGAVATIASDRLTLDANAKGSDAYAEQAVSTSSADTEHALEIHVTRGPIEFRCGSTSGGEDYISETTLDTGYHSLSFTPTDSTYYVRFLTRRQREARVNSIEVASAGEMQLTAPWTAAQLRSISFDQSADIVYLANANWRQRKIERRGTRSWSVVEYHADDGPFRPATTQTIGLTPSANANEATITADGAAFNSTMVGSLIRLFHQRTDSTVDLAGDDVYTDVFVTRGVKASFYNDRAFTYTITGTWTGTIRVQRSLTGPDGDFHDFTAIQNSATIDTTTNVSRTHLDEADSNNLVAYMRVGFVDGKYTSGVATLQIQYEGYSAQGIGRITAVNAEDEIEVEVLDNFNAISNTRNWRLGSWSQLYGWPSAVVFYDGRLFWGGKDEFWGSESDSFTAFGLETEGDSGSIQRSVATGGQVSQINWFLPLQRLIIGTVGAEVSVRSSSFDEPLTPDNITLKDASTYGSSEISPIKIDSRGIFVHRSGRAVYALQYSFDANDYVAVDLTRYNEDICGDGIVELTSQREPEPYIWAARQDGQCAILIYGPDQEIEGWSRFITAPTAAASDTVVSVASLPGAIEDSVYLSVERTINGSTVYMLEKLTQRSYAEGAADNRMADAHVTYDGPITTCTGLDHLEGETVIAWGNGKDLGSYTVSSGQITLSEEATTVCVGLKYSWRYKSSRLAYGGTGGTALLQKKQVPRIGAVLSNTHHRAFRVSNQSFDKMFDLPQTKDGKAVAEDTIYSAFDEVSFAVGGKWDTDSRVYLSGDAPLPATINALVYDVDTNPN